MITVATFGILGVLAAAAFVVILVSLLAGDSAVAIAIATMISAVATMGTTVVNVAKERPQPVSAGSVPSNAPAAIIPQKATMPFTLARSFEAGVYGGLLGGAFAGLVLGLAYTSQIGFALAFLQLSSARLVAEIFVTGCVCGALMGAATQFGAHWFRHLRTNGRGPAVLYNEAVGGGLFGIAAGVISGLLVGLTFGPRPLPMIDGNLLIIAAVFGAVAIPAGALLYDFRGSLRLLFRAYVLCAVLTALLLVPVALLLMGVNVFDWFYRESLWWYAAGGATIGACLLGVAGVEIGATLRLHRLWLDIEHARLAADRSAL